MADLAQTLVSVDGGQRLESNDREPAPDQVKADKVRAFLELALRRWRTVAEAEQEIRRDMLDDKRFLASDQWVENIKAARMADQKPCLTINRLPAFVQQVVNECRQSRASIQINPVDGGADPKTAEALQGLCRNIETNSDADVAYMTAAEDQIAIGRGYWRVVTDYADDDSFEQEIRIRRIRNPFTVYLDAAGIGADGSDAEFGFVIEDLTRDTFARKYPGKESASASHMQSIGDSAPNWLTGDSVRIAEYFYVEYVKRRKLLIAFNDGATVTLDADMPGLQDSIDAGEVKVLRERESLQRQVKWATISATEILDGNEDGTAGRDWPGKYIPIVQALGVELDIDGRRDLRGMVRDAKDPQRAYNVWVSAMTETIGLAPRAPYLVAEGQITGHEALWKKANTANLPYLTYKEATIGGVAVPPPQRQSFEPPVRAIVEATRQADTDLKAVMGMFDASQERSPEQSGKAILARQRQGEMGNSHYADNLARAIRYTGKILLDLIPRIYDAPRVVRINGLDDEQEKTVMIHAGQGKSAGVLKQKLTGEIAGIYDIGVGRYDVTVSTGPSYQSRRQEAVESMVQLTQANPAIFPMIGDILVQNMDWPGAPEIAKRLKRMVPPQAMTPEGEGSEMPPEAAAQVQALTQQLEQMQQALQGAQQQIATDQAKAQAQVQIKTMETASRERIAQMQIEADLTKTQAELNHARAQAMLDVQVRTLEQRFGAGQQVATSQADREHEIAMTREGRAHEQASAEAQAARDGDAADAAAQRDAQLAAEAPPEAPAVA